MRFKKVLVLGASGSTGRHVVDQALERGHHVTAFVRPGVSLEGRDRLEIHHGQVLENASLKAAMAGMDAVVSCLGINRKNAANPWTKLLSPTDFLEQSARAIVAAMDAGKVGRLVAISAGGAGDSYSRVDAPTKVLFRLSQIGKTVTDAGRMEAVFAGSGLDWYAARPVRLVDDPPSGQLRAVEHARVSDTTNRADLARWLLDKLEQSSHFETRTEIVALA